MIVLQSMRHRCEERKRREQQENVENVKLQAGKLFSAT